MGRCNTSGSASADAAGHCGGVKEKRSHRREQDLQLRCDFLPECYMACTAIRERWRTLRYRNLLVRQMVQMKNKISGLLMERGVNYTKLRIHKTGYFRELLATNPDIDEGLCSLPRLCRETVVRRQKTESALARSLERDALLVEHVERLLTIPPVGPRALTWALE
jgi:hypothetical protein